MRIRNPGSRRANQSLFGSVADPECFSQIWIFPFPIPDPNFFHPGSQVRIKEFRYFNPKNSFLSYLGNMIRVVHPGSGYRILTFTHPGSGVQKGTGSRIRIRNTAVFGKETLGFNLFAAADRRCPRHPRPPPSPRLPRDRAWSEGKLSCSRHSLLISETPASNRYRTGTSSTAGTVKSSWNTCCFVTCVACCWYYMLYRRTRIDWHESGWIGSQQIACKSAQVVIPLGELKLK